MDSKLNPPFLVSKLHSLPWDNISKSPCDKLTTQRLDSYWTGLTLPHTTLIASFWQTVISVFFCFFFWLVGRVDPLQKPPTVESLNTQNPETFAHSYINPQSHTWAISKQATQREWSQCGSAQHAGRIPSNTTSHRETETGGRSLTPTFTEAQCWSPSSYRACS